MRCLSGLPAPPPGPRRRRPGRSRWPGRPGRGCRPAGRGCRSHGPSRSARRGRSTGSPSRTARRGRCRRSPRCDCSSRRRPRSYGPGRQPVRMPPDRDPVRVVVHDQPADPQASRRPRRPRRTRRTCRCACPRRTPRLPRTRRAAGRRPRSGRPAAAPIRAMSSRRFRSNSANIGRSNTTPSSRPSASRPKAPSGGSGCPSANPVSLSAAVFSTSRPRAGRCGRPHRQAGHRLVQIRPGRGPDPPRSLYSTYPGPGHPRALRGPAGDLAQPRLDRRDVRRGRLAAVRRRRQVADVGDVAVRVDQPGDDGGPVQPHHGRARRGRRPGPPRSSRPRRSARP